MAFRGSEASATRKDRMQRVFALCLMGIAGWCDASGFLLFAQLYVSFMSGDATQLGLKLAEGDTMAAAKFFGAQAAFVAGAALGRHVRTRHPDDGRRVILIANILLLSMAALLGGHTWGFASFVFVVLAMGLQNAVMTHEAGVLVGTMVTGALARLGFSIADRLHGQRSAILDNFGQWFFFVFGALLGALVFRGLGAASFWIPAIASASLLPLAARLPRMIDHPTARTA